MDGKYFLIDTTRCTACRGCQVACKNWNKLPADKTKQRGSYQNPPDLNGDTYRLVRFAEHPAKKNRVTWYFFSDACRHCLNPPCREAAEEYVKDAIVVNRFGAVLYTNKTRQLMEQAQEIKDACPWSIPNWSARENRLVKCHMCHERVEAGLLPACVAACPTGALCFGDKGQMEKLAQMRLGQARAKHGPRAQILDQGDVRALYLVTDEYAKYLQTA